MNIRNFEKRSLSEISPYLLQCLIFTRAIGKLPRLDAAMKSQGKRCKTRIARGIPNRKERRDRLRLDGHKLSFIFDVINVYSWSFRKRSVTVEWISGNAVYLNVIFIQRLNKRYIENLHVLVIESYLRN